MSTTATRPASSTRPRTTDPSILEIADLSIEDILMLLDGPAPGHRLSGTYVVDVPHALAHMRQAVSAAVVRAGGRVLVSDWPSLWTDRGNPIGAQLRPPLRAAVVGLDDHRALQRYAERSAVPIINAGSDLHRPVQVLADLLTVKDLLGHLRGATFAFVGGPRSYRTSLIQAAARAGIDLVICTDGNDPTMRADLDEARPIAHLFGSNLTVTDPTRTVVSVDVLLGEPTPFGLFATKTHLPLELTGSAADSGITALEGPRSLLFHREQNLERIFHRLLALVGAPPVATPAGDDQTGGGPS